MEYAEFYNGNRDKNLPTRMVGVDSYFPETNSHNIITVFFNWLIFAGILKRVLEERDYIQERGFFERKKYLSSFDDRW